jgi:serine/threonine protein phosphatase PrpC
MSDAVHVSVSTHAGYTATRPSVVDGAAYTEDYSARFHVGRKWVSCIFDGHGGHGVAAALAALAPALAAECFARRDTTEGGLVLLFERLDAEVSRAGESESGATCNVTVVEDGVVTVASLGDSPMLVYERVGQTYRCAFATEDQDCADEEEQRRLCALGLSVYEQKVLGTGGLMHGTGVYRCRTAAKKDMMVMSSFGDSAQDEPRGAVNKVPRVYAGRRIARGSVLVHCSDGCLEDVAPYAPSLLKPSAETRVGAIAAHIQEAMCGACGLLVSADLAAHLTRRQVESIARERSLLMGACDEDRGWVERNFDNQTVVAVYFGERCGCLSA